MQQSSVENFKPTVLGYAILGLAQEESRSGYSIRKVFETTALGVYSSSPGSIYPALNRLEKNGLVQKKVINNSQKSRYHITELGQLALKNWMLCPIERVDVAKYREEQFLKFAFMEDLLTFDQKLNFLRSFRDQLKAYIKDLKSFHLQEASNLPIHGRLSFEHGIATCQTTLNWCKQTIRFFQDQSESHTQ